MQWCHCPPALPESPLPKSVPNYLTTNSSGEAGAVFPGGVQVTAGTDATPTNERRIRWIRDSDGALIAELFGYKFGGISNLLLTANDPDSAGAQGEIQLSAGAIPFDTGVDVFVTPSGGATIGAKLLDATGRSGFLKLAVNADIGVKFASVVFAAPGGWTTGTLNLPGPAFNTVRHCYYSLQESVGAAMTSHAIGGQNGTQIFVDMNTTVPMNVTIFGLMLGR